MNKDNRYLVFWILDGTMKMGVEVEVIKGVMNFAEFNDLKKRLKKKYGKNLFISSFSKFEGRDLPVIEVKKP